jgi:hypothetical protein
MRDHDDRMTFEILLVVSNGAPHVQARKVARCMREHDDCMTYEILSVVSNIALPCSGTEGDEVYERA